MKTRSPVLTQDERDVLILASYHPGDQHLTNGEIAKRLGVSVTTVKTLLHQACLKLGADNRNEAVLFAAKRGEISFTELLSLDEQAELLSPLGPGVLRKIAQRVREGQEIRDLPEMDAQALTAIRIHDGLLTNRERDVLILVGRGLTNAEIADTLCMSSSAVRTFLNRAFLKLGARKRADAVRLALRQREIIIGDIFSLGEALQDLVSLGAESFEKIATLLEEQAREEPDLAGD
jgi:DNA-binding CsgD family transcriptional regulator